MNIGPISPKAHGAWLGAGSGAAAGNEIIALIQTYAHTTLPPATVTLIYTLMPALAAFVGAWLAPLLPSTIWEQIQPKPVVPAATKLTDFENLRPIPASSSSEVATWPTTSGGSAT